MTIDDAKAFLRQHWPNIRSQLLDGNYRPQPVKRVLVSPESSCLCRLNSIEPPWYGPVCPVVWEGWRRETSPYPDLWALFGHRCLSQRPLRADIVAKVFLGWRTKILRAADASYARRREGPYRFTQNRSRISVVALKSDAAAEKSKMNFREIFTVVRFSTFATISARTGPSSNFDPRCHGLCGSQK
jgi:hypothetical protein